MKLFNPIGPRKITWDFISGLAVLFIMLEVPFRISLLHDQPYNSLTSILETIVVAIFFVDILITFNTAYDDTSTNTLVTDRKLIAKRYIMFWFWFDFISAIPFDRISDSTTTTHSTIHILRIFRILRLAKSFKTSRLIRNKLDQWDIDPAISNVITLAFQVFFVAHFVGCFWFFITIQDNDVTTPTWLTTYGYDKKDLISQYIASLYWTFTTLLTVGYGDIHATNSSERFYSVCTMLIGAMMFGAIIAKVTEVIESRNIIPMEIRDKEEEFKAYLEERRIPSNLKLQAKVSK